MRETRKSVKAAKQGNRINNKTFCLQCKIYRRKFGNQRLWRRSGSSMKQEATCGVSLLAIQASRFFDIAAIKNISATEVPYKKHL